MLTKLVYCIIKFYCLLTIRVHLIDDFVVGLQKIKYSCIEVDKNIESLIAVVCEDDKEEDTKKPNIVKCCPEGEGLTRNYSSCSSIEHDWIPSNTPPNRPDDWSL